MGIVLEFVQKFVLKFILEFALDFVLEFVLKFVLEFVLEFALECCFTLLGRGMTYFDAIYAPLCRCLISSLWTDDMIGRRILLAYHVVLYIV